MLFGSIGVSSRITEKRSAARDAGSLVTENVYCGVVLKSIVPPVKLSTNVVFTPRNTPEASVESVYDPGSRSFTCSLMVLPHGISFVAFIAIRSEERRVGKEL